MKSFAEFWPFYCREHSRPLTRRLHLAGSLLGPLAAIGLYSATGSPFSLAAIPLFGYAFAWTSHFFIEKNRPATFKYPLWSLMGDYKMAWKMVTGTMGEELRRARG